MRYNKYIQLKLIVPKVVSFLVRQCYYYIDKICNMLSDVYNGAGYLVFFFYEIKLTFSLISSCKGHKLTYNNIIY